IHPRALRLIRQNLKKIDREVRNDPVANHLFLEILTYRKGPGSILRMMNEAGVFGRFIPDFGRVVAQMQYDMYHVYTVDEHTIRAIELLSEVEQGTLAEDHPLANEIIHKVISRRVLYVAVLLHDIAKGRKATIRCWAKRWRASFVPASAFLRQRRKRWPGWCAGTC
ncbi:hypothetical protein ACFQH4_00330, partial [Pseudidiomarina halophila]